MGCKGPFDARFETAQSARRALSDYAIQHAQKRNLKNMVCSVFLPHTFKKNQEIIQKKIKMSRNCFLIRYLRS